MRTDKEVLADVTDELDWDAAIDARLITVAVRDGLVTLGGEVNSFSEKWEAERATQRVTGVKATVVEIRVAPPGAKSDLDIAAAAGHALAWVSFVPQNCVKIQVEDGWNTLSGSVAWDYQRQNAVASVRFLSGVKGLSNNILVTADAPSDTLQADIEKALERRFDAADQDIKVSVSGRDVTLSGTVASWWQRNQARDSAWNAPGVQNVKDDLTVRD